MSGAKKIRRGDYAFTLVERPDGDHVLVWHSESACEPFKFQRKVFIPQEEFRSGRQHRS